jgi:lysophospholipase L1-like esterase
MTSPNVRARTISTRRKVLFTAGLILAMLVVLESVVRVRALMRYGSTAAGIDSMLVADAATGLRTPKAGWVQQGSKISVSINSLGFRGGELTRQKPPRTIRIATVGASTTFCGEVANEETWPARLQELLQRAHPDVTIEVINAGVPGFVAAESLKNLQARVLPLEPDLVVYYEANNDMANDTRDLARSQGLLPATPSLLAKALSNHSLLFDLAQKNIRILTARSGSDAKLGNLPADLPTRYIGTLDEMRRLTADRDIDFVLSTFIVKYRRDQPRATQVQNASIAFFYMPWMTIEGLLDGTDLYNRALIQYAGLRGVPIVDDSDSVPGDDQHFVDWAHFSSDGTTKMAQRFARFFEAHGLIQKIVKRKGLSRG